jgi:hypothetical protein
MTVSDFRISPKYHKSDWDKLAFNTQEDWVAAIDIVEDRIKGRLIQWIDQIEPSRFSGFAMVALDCLLIETIYGFQHGASTMDTKAPYRAILPLPELGFDSATVESFIEDVRNAMVHDTETRKRWLIEMNLPAIGIVERDSSGNFVLNRRHFHSGLRDVLNHWLERLRSGDLVGRQKMKERMLQIIEKHFST